MEAILKLCHFFTSQKPDILTKGHTVLTTTVGAVLDFVGGIQRQQMALKYCFLSFTAQGKERENIERGCRSHMKTTVVFMSECFYLNQH